MSAQLKKSRKSDDFTLAVRDWLSGEASGNLGPYMYVNDKDDHRWKSGHSAKSYYVTGDEKSTFELALKELDIQADNFIDLGPGGGASVESKSLAIATKVSATNYFPVDLSPWLAHAASKLVAEKSEIGGTPIIADFFKHIPIVKPNALISLLGLTLGNFETHSDLPSLHSRLRQIFKCYRAAVTGESYLLVSNDCNSNDHELLACYQGDKFETLVRTCLDRAIETEGFSYDVVWTPRNYQLALGLRSRRDQMVKFDATSFAIEAGDFFPVINSYRFPLQFLAHAANSAGWIHKKTWSATGRVHYLLFAAE